MVQRKKKLRAKRVKNRGGRPPGRKKPPSIFELPNFPTFDEIFGPSKPRKKKKR